MHTCSLARPLPSSGFSGLPVLQGVAPGRGRGPAADEPKIYSKLRRTDPPVGIGLDRDVGAVPERVNLETEIVTAGIDDPELENTGPGVKRWKSFGVLLDRAVADDLQDEVHGPFERGEP